MDPEIPEKISLIVESIGSLSKNEKTTLIDQCVNALRTDLIFKSTDLSKLINSEFWLKYPLPLKIKLDFEIGFKDLPVVVDEEGNV